MQNEPVRVVIYDAPTASASSCACGCGGHHHHGFGDDPLEGVSMEMQAKALALTMETVFPGRVCVEYINVLQDPRGPNLPQTALLTSLAYSAPLVYIEGQGWFAGTLDPERIRDEVGKCLEQRQERH